jgi:hypothetical protein
MEGFVGSFWTWGVPGAASISTASLIATNREAGATRVNAERRYTRGNRCGKVFDGLDKEIRERNADIRTVAFSLAVVATNACITLPPP